MSSGKCEGPDCEITMVGDDSPPGSDTAEVFKSQLEAMGFKVNFQKVTHDIMYTKFCSVPSNAPDVCPNVGWLKDFNDGQSMIDVPFNGDHDRPGEQLQLATAQRAGGQQGDGEGRDLIDDPAERRQAWGDVDTLINEQAPAVPWVWDNQANIASSDVAGVINKSNANWDLSFTSLK